MRSFWVCASFRLCHRPQRACSFAKASLKPKNPRTARLQYFFNRSSFPVGYIGHIAYSRRVMMLETIPLFRQLNRAELQALRQITQERKLVAEEEIFREGDPGDGVYFVKAGRVAISVGKNDRRVLSHLGPGEIFGEMAVIEHRPRSANASAVGAG